MVHALEGKKKYLTRQKKPQQDPVNGAQLAGSWAVRETFVAVLTTNLPMLWKFLRFAVSPFLGSFASRSRSRSLGSRLWRTPHGGNKWRGGGGGGGGGRTPEPGSFQLQDGVSSGTTMGSRGAAKTMYPIPALSESEERIMSGQTMAAAHYHDDSDKGAYEHTKQAGKRSSGIKVMRDFKVSVEETTESYRLERVSGDAYIHPTNTTAGVSVISKR